MNKHASVIAFFALVLVILACGTTGVAPAVETAEAGAVETPVTVTVQAQETTPTSAPATLTPSPISSPTAEPPSPTPTEKAPICQEHPGGQHLPLPVGYVGSIDAQTVELYDTDGELLGRKQTPGLSFLEPDQVHLGGGLTEGIAAIPFVYHSLEHGGGLKASAGTATVDLAQTPGLVTLIGAEGSPLIAYSTNESDQATGGWLSELYASEISAIDGATVRLTRSEGDGFVIYPLAVHTEAGVGQGVWYTLSMWGIGNIIFPPYNGLFYFRLSDGQVIEYLSVDNRLAGFSPDQTTVAFAPLQEEQPGGIQLGLTVKNLVTCQETFIAINPSTNLGAGYAVFSPDNRYMAWLEASGPDNMQARIRLRVAETANGNILVDSETPGLSSLAGGEAPSTVQPLGWLADHLLLLEVGLPSQVNPLLVVWAPDPTEPLDPALGANQSAPLSEGVFAGFLYP
jgi:hypothetical protein